tara:strand:+ start:213 stop:338 length:126 start_codon:yes stop_codon:yes gene_type:complete
VGEAPVSITGIGHFFIDIGHHAFLNGEIDEEIYIYIDHSTI